MNFCLFQGTFNPIHNAHLAMAQFVLDNFKFDKIIFVPASKPPHKGFNDDLSLHCLAMTKLAVEDNEKFLVDDVEFKSQNPSYTYLTLQALSKKHNVKKFDFIIGEDAFEKIESWYETDKLKKMVDFIIFQRGYKENEKKLSDLKKKGYNYRVANMDFIDISSTKIREKIKKNESLKDLVPVKVEEYIEKNGLYK